MTNLDSVLKSRDVTLLPKVHLVKATVFPVINTTVRAGPQRRWIPLNCGAGENS